MLEEPNIAHDELRAGLQEHYVISPASLDFLPIGHDADAGAYCVVELDGTRYFLKVRRRSMYEPTYLMPRYLRDQGIACVVAPLRTSQNALWTQIAGWTLSVYPFIEGDTGMKLGMTDDNWRELGTVFRRIHGLPLPPEGFQLLREETFDPSEYRYWVRRIDSRVAAPEVGSEVERALTSAWLTYQPTIHSLVASMEKLGPILQERSGPRVICHADLHANNVLRDPTEHVHVVDWDDVKLAPKERDFLFVGEPVEGDASSQDTPPFFQGYGKTEIDWTALAYYRCERAVQDVIENASQVLFRDDLNGGTKATAVQLFHLTFDQDNHAEAARAAVARVS
jgi:spectinomycin phosphotransferase